MDLLSALTTEENCEEECEECPLKALLKLTLGDWGIHQVGTMCEWIQTFKDLFEDENNRV